MPDDLSLIAGRVRASLVLIGLVLLWRLDAARPASPASLGPSNGAYSVPAPSVRTRHIHRNFDRPGTHPLTCSRLLQGRQQPAR